MRRTTTEKKGAWVLGALLVAGLHAAAVRDANDAPPDERPSQTSQQPAGYGLVPLRDVSSLWPRASAPAEPSDGPRSRGDRWSSESDGGIAVVPQPDTAQSSTAWPTR